MSSTVVHVPLMQGKCTSNQYQRKWYAPNVGTWAGRQRQEIGTPTGARNGMMTQGLDIGAPTRARIRVMTQGLDLGAPTSARGGMTKYGVQLPAA